MAARDIELNGVTYEDVPAINAKTPGGVNVKFPDVSDTTAAAADVAQGKYFYNASGERTAGTNTGGSVPTQNKYATPTKSRQTIRPDSGFLLAEVTVEPIPNQYIIPTGSQTYTQNGTVDVTALAEAVINVSPTMNLQNKSRTFTPSETQQTAAITADSGYDGLGTVNVTVNAIPTNYVGSGVTRRSSADLSESGGDVTAPAGYYENAAVFSMPIQTHPDPTISVSASGLITASHAQGEGWVQADTSTATQQLSTVAGQTVTPTRQEQTIVPAGSYATGAIKVGAIPSEYIIPTGQTLITENGEWDVTDFETAVVNVAGGGGLTYETGTWTPTADIARGTISFSNSHSEPPVAIVLADATGTASSTTNSNHMFVWFDVQRLTGHGFPYSSSGFRYAAAYYSYRGSSTSSLSNSGYLCSQQTTSTGASGVSYPKYWATASEFHPYSQSTSRYWRAGRTFKWIAIWKP